MMLDVSRHFFTKEEVKRLLDMMARQKLNKFHWHLTDDHGWRFEVPGLPKLTEVGARQAGEGPLRPQYYTTEELREVVAYAAERHIEVIPEVDVPGHSTAAIAAYPWLGNQHAKNYTLPTAPAPTGQWGPTKNTLAPGDESLAFLKTVLTHLASVFPSPHVHVGGDEADVGQWVKTPLKNRAIKRPRRTQYYFTEEVTRIAQDLGKVPSAWNEVLRTGGAPAGTVITVWENNLRLRDALASGHPTINAMQDYLYLDHYQSYEFEKEPRSILKPGLPLQKVYDFDVGAEATEEQERDILLGGQAQLWSEYLENWEKVEYMAHPRSFAVAEAFWSPQEYVRRPGAFDDFQQRLSTRLKDLDRMGVNYRTPQDADNVKP